MLQICSTVVSAAAEQPDSPRQSATVVSAAEQRPDYPHNAHPWCQRLLKQPDSPHQSGTVVSAADPRPDCPHNAQLRCCSCFSRYGERFRTGTDFRSCRTFWYAGCWHPGWRAVFGLRMLSGPRSLRPYNVVGGTWSCGAGWYARCADSQISPGAFCCIKPDVFCSKCGSARAPFLLHRTDVFSSKSSCRSCYCSCCRY